MLVFLNYDIFPSMKSVSTSKKKVDLDKMQLNMANHTALYFFQSPNLGVSSIQRVQGTLVRHLKIGARVMSTCRFVKTGFIIILNISSKKYRPFIQNV